MPSQSPSNRVWDHAEALVVELEQSSRGIDPGGTFYSHAVESFAEFECSTAALYVIENGQSVCLARLNECDSTLGDALPIDAVDAAPASHWQRSNRANVNGTTQVLTVIQRVHLDVKLALVLQWQGGAPSLRDVALPSLLAPGEGGARALLSPLPRALRR